MPSRPYTFLICIAYSCVRIYTCQVRPFSSPDPKKAKNGFKMNVCFSPSIWCKLRLSIHPWLHAKFPYNKFSNFIKTTVCVSHYLSNLPVGLLSFVFFLLFFPSHVTSKLVAALNPQTHSCGACLCC